MTKEELKDKARRIKLMLTDCDGVLTDGGVYYSALGEELKKFNLRDGMGVERLRNLCSIDTGIITGENSPIVSKRAEKLRMTHLYLHIKNKKEKLAEILTATSLSADEIAYIGDDMNDLEVIQMVGISACPADAVDLVLSSVDYQCKCKGGAGAFREFAELLINLRQG